MVEYYEKNHLVTGQRRMKMEAIPVIVLSWCS